MAKSISTNELKRLMNLNNIKRVPLFNNGTFLGYVTNELRYDTTNAFSYYTDRKYAMEAACNQIEPFIEAVKKITSKEVVEIEVTEVVYGEEKPLKFSNTLDKIFEGFEKANNKLRYCNGHYFQFKDKDVQTLYRIWLKVADDARLFHLYYGDGVVD